MGPSGKIRLAVLFGGRSAEHDVSLRSARSVLQNLDSDRYEILLGGITREGGWLDPADSQRLLEGGQPLARGGAPFLPAGTECVFPVLHGPGGEDGSLQGWLELMDVPFVGSGSTGSAVAMDKSLAKHILRDSKVPLLSWSDVDGREYERDPATVADRVVAERGLPVFVKPARLGSSVGINRAETPAELQRALEEALQHGRWAIVEPAVDAREFELAVLDGEPLLASHPGEVRAREWYDYRSKYLDDSAELLVPAPDLQEGMVRRMQGIACDAFRLLRLDGMARADFFIGRKTGRPVLNEVNTIPGFTTISLYPRLMEHAGVPFHALCDRLVDLAVQQHGRRRAWAAPRTRR